MLLSPGGYRIVEAGMFVTLLGALLIFLGILYLAAQALRRGRLSAGTPERPVAQAGSLEPPGRVTAFRLGANWPGLALIALGAILLIAVAAIPAAS
ncbi:hypothetical protein [Geminicoccus flavidas]|uniref:hypothetical protein n=1 Tax=Geminicoccus flavidas TaxID=2506407 RepID=UPI0013585A3D|nr:hypothetical protein [Geminicoccus flavidas]